MALTLLNDPLTIREGNPYWDWIKSYGSPGFQTSVRIGREGLESLFQIHHPSTQTFEELKLIFSKVRVILNPKISKI